MLLSPALSSSTGGRTDWNSAGSPTLPMRRLCLEPAEDRLRRVAHVERVRALDPDVHLDPPVMPVIQAEVGRVAQDGLRRFQLQVPQRLADERADARAAAGFLRHRRRDHKRPAQGQQAALEQRAAEHLRRQAAFAVRRAQSVKRPIGAPAAVEWFFPGRFRTGRRRVHVPVQQQHRLTLAAVENPDDVAGLVSHDAVVADLGQLALHQVRDLLLLEARARRPDERARELQDLVRQRRVLRLQHRVHGFVSFQEKVCQLHQ